MTTRPLISFFRSVPVLTSDTSVASAQCALDKTVRELLTNKTSYKEATRKFQQRFIVEMLMLHACHLGRAAQELGMHRNTLTRTIRELNIDIRQVRKDVRTLKRRKTRTMNAPGLIIHRQQQMKETL